MGCPGAPRGSGRSPDMVSKKWSKNVVKTNVSGKIRYPANPIGPSGAPGALRGSLCSAKAHVENPWKNKGKRRSPLRIWGAAVGCAGGDQRGPNPGHGFPKTVQKQWKFMHFWQNPLHSKFTGAICSGTSLDSVSFCNRPGPGSHAKRACAKPLEIQRKSQVSPEAPDDPPDVFQITAWFPGTSITL